MNVCSAELIFSVYGARSLKDKRQVARGMMDRCRHKFNVAIAEVGSQDHHQRLTIGVAVVSGDADHAKTMLQNIIRHLEGNEDAVLVTITEG